MDVPFDEVEFSDEQRIKAVLPEGYILRPLWLDGVFEVVNLTYLVAGKVWIMKPNGRIVIHFEPYVHDPKTAGKAFAQALVERHPKFDPNKLFWVLVIPDEILGWCFRNRDSVDEVSALKGVDLYDLTAGLFLCAYRKSDWDNEGRSVLTSKTYPIVNLGVEHGDVGPRSFHFGGKEIVPVRRSEIMPF